jgi:hypothetical protein
VGSFKYFGSKIVTQKNVRRRNYEKNRRCRKMPKKGKSVPASKLKVHINI